MYSHYLSSRTLITSPKKRLFPVLEQCHVSRPFTSERSRPVRFTPGHLHANSESVETSGGVLEVEQDTEFENVKQIMRRVGEGEDISPFEISDAFVFLEKKRIKYEDLEDRVGGGPEGKYWNLQFVSRKDSLKKGGRGGGFRFPLTAIQHFDNGKLSNGVYFKYVASLSFSGTYSFRKNSMAFTFDRIRIKLGPADFSFPMKGSGDSSAEGLFVFFYVDEDSLVARGKTGGTALFKRVSPSWVLEHGGG